MGLGAPSAFSSSSGSSFCLIKLVHESLPSSVSSSSIPGDPMPSYAPSQSSVIVEWGQSRDMEVIGWALGGIIRWKSCSVGKT